MKTLFILLAPACVVVAAVFAFMEDYDKAFVAAAAGAVCWILNYRLQLRERLSRREEENEVDEESDEEVSSE